jgi:DNA-binding MarR family transcriptional regulator
MDDMSISQVPPASASPDAAAGGAADDRAVAVQALEASFSELMTAFRRYMAAAAERVSPGMLPGAFKALSTVDRQGPITLSALAERLTADKGMVSRTVSELEELGLITRTPDPEDRRSRLIAVTERGAERLAVARAPHEGRLFAVLEDWSLHDIRHLTTLLHALATGESPARD